MSNRISSIAGIEEKHLAGRHDQKLHRGKGATTKKPKATPEKIRRNKARIKVIQALMSVGCSASIIGGLYSAIKLAEAHNRLPSNQVKREIINEVNDAPLEEQLRQANESATQMLENWKKKIAEAEDSSMIGTLPSKPEEVKPSEKLIHTRTVDAAQDIINAAFGEEDAPPNPKDLLKKHLAGQHDQKRHATHIFTKEEESEYMSADEVRKLLGLNPKDRNSLSRFVGHARVGRDKYNRKAAQEAIDKIIEQRAAREDVQDLSQSLGMDADWLRDKIRNQGVTPGDILKQESHLSQAASELKASIKQALGKQELRSQISDVQRDFLTALYGVDRPKETLAKLAKRAEDAFGDPYTPAWVRMQIVLAESKLGVDVDKIAFNHGVQRRELIRYINRSTKGK